MKNIKQSLNNSIFLKSIGINKILILTPKSVNTIGLNKIAFSKCTTLYSYLFPTFISKGIKFPVNFYWFNSWLEYFLIKSINPFYFKYKKYFFINKKVIQLIQELSILKNLQISLNSSIYILNRFRILTL
jgi:hypothetical protein